jgi:hypothetical protein
MCVFRARLFSLESMGGHGKFPAPSWVWTPYGGWWPHPKSYVRGTIVTGLVIASITAVVFIESSKKERRHNYPHRWIPSMLWAKEFRTLR